MSIAQVTTSTIITAAKYNEIQSTITNIIVNEYGYTVKSSSVSADTIIVPSRWDELKYDIDRCKVHQTNTATTATPTSSAYKVPVLSSEYAGTLIRSANEAFANRYTAHPEQLSFTSTSTAAPSGQWVTNEDTFVHKWNTVADAKQFFALGGYVAVSMSANSTTGLGAVVSEANAVLATKSYSATDYNYLVPVIKTWVSKTSSAGTATVISTLVKGPGPAVLTTVVKVVTSPSAPVTMAMNTTVTTYCSINLGGAIPGFSAQPPEIKVNDGGASAVRYLSTSPTSLNQYVWPSGTSSAAQTITLTNSGNVTLEISDILYSTAGGVTAIPQYNWGDGVTPQLIIPVGESYTFTLAYLGTAVGGPYSNTVTIKSNNDRGDVIINTSQYINLPIFTMSLSPSSTDTLTAEIPLTRQYLVNVNRAAAPTFSASLSGSGLFSITSEPGVNPISVTFSPTNDTVNDTYEATLSVTATEVGSVSVTRTAVMTVNYALPQPENLSNWLSPLAQNNSVVGISYDKVGPKLYLTIGIGTGADGVPSLTAEFPNYVPLTYLTMDNWVDVGYSETAGPALYRMRYDPRHIQFLRDYGVWIRPDRGDDASVGPINSPVTRSYTFTVPESKTYNWIFSVDNYGYFAIDDVLQGNFSTVPSRGDPEYWTKTQTSSVYLTSGTHTITFSVTNAGGRYALPSPAGIAIRLYDSSQPDVANYDIWSTLTPARALDPYLDWNQVFRIPISGNAGTYQLTRNYCVKDTGPISWSDYFNPFITITDNGTNRLNITFNLQSGNSTDPTIVALPYSPYYYVNSQDPAVGVRIADLDDGSVNGVPGQTRMFTGFSVTRDNAGSVVSATPATRLFQPYPGYGYTAYVYDNQGGGFTPDAPDSPTSTPDGNIGNPAAADGVAPSGDSGSSASSGGAVGAPSGSGE